MSFSATMVAGTTKRSEKQIEKMRPVSRTACSTARKLIERRDARLVDHHVLAMRHGVDRDSRPDRAEWPRRRSVDVRILEKTPRIVHLCELGKAFLETCENPRVARRGIVAGANRAGCQKTFHHMVDMAMIEADDGEAHYFAAPPISWSQRLKAATSFSGVSGTTVGNLAIRSS